MLEVIIVILFTAGILYAILAANPMSFDDLIELKFLPSRRRSREDLLEEVRSKINPRGVCKNKGKINNSWTDQRCECTGWEFKKMYYGAPLCKCGCFYLDHSDTGRSTSSGAAANMENIE